jgi:hypothetical protein
MNVRTVLPALALVAALPLAAPAAKVKVWNHHAAADHDRAQFKHAVVSSEGALHLARQLKPLAGLDATHVWALAEDRTGNLYAASGDEGRLYKIAADGKVTIAYTSEDSQILCLAVAADGSVYLGTGPEGRVVRIDPRGAAKVLFEGKEQYVWSLAFDARGEALYAGTGPKGRIYKLAPDGQATLFYATKQDHILCLAAGLDGSLYAGSDKAGLVYRIDAAGKGFVVFSAAQAEIRTLLVTPDGIYAGTSSPNSRRSGSLVSRSESAGSSGDKAAAVASTSDKVVAAEGARVASGPNLPSEGKDSGKGASAAAPAQPARSGENSIYRIGADGTVREVFREKALILSMLRQDGRLFVGTGMEGQLFEVDEASRERSEIARLDHGQILSLCRRHDGSIVLGTGDPGKLYVLQPKYAAVGSVTSEVLDAKLLSKWGAIRWTAGTPTGTGVTVAVRSGNVADPDETWSAWSAEQADAGQAVATAPAARFLQYRVTLRTDDPAATPALRDLTLRYKNANQAPEVSSLEVPNLDAANLDNPKRLRFKWAATDANEDELTYSIYVKKDGWKDWVLLDDDLEKKEYEWDTTTTPAGRYQVKVVATDRRDNSAEEALTGERIGAAFVVAHVPPAVVITFKEMDGDAALLEATATDELVRLTSASFSVNGKRWVNVFPVDGLFDSKAESFRFKTEGLKPGTYVVVLRVKDAAGNTGSGDVVFTVPAVPAK